MTSHVMKTLNRIVKPQLCPNERTNQSQSKKQSSNSNQTIDKFIQIRAPKETSKISITIYPINNLK
jgi:hypothetical protein